MFRRYRQRRGPYALARPSVVPSFIRSFILLAVACLVLYFIGRGILSLFGMGSNGDRAPITLTIEDRGTVNVALEGGLMQRAENSLKLYASDKISTSSNGHARLDFFDHSWVRTDNSTDLTIDASAVGKDDATMQLTLTKGALWVDTPATSTYSGSVTRTIVTPAFTATFPSDTQAMIDGSTLLVFNADGNGVGVTLKGSKVEEYIGEGQQMILPDTPTESAVHYRSAIDPLAAQKTFVLQSKSFARSGQQGMTGTGTTVFMDPNSIEVTSPANNAVITGDTVTVSGKIGANVDRIRINGHAADVDRAAATFTEELALSTSAITNLQIEAMDANDTVLVTVTRSVKKATQAFKAPTITSPAGNGQTYRTQESQIELKGTAPAGVAGIMVNDYKLQLFRTGDTTWSYLASKQLNNLVDGKNIFNVYALDADGNPSAPASLTILVEAGAVGVVSTGSTVGNTSSVAAPIDETKLPQNAPLTPGVIAVTGPAAGTSFTATGSDILIEGTTSAQTAAIWINGYKLQLYKPGKTYWNYIAKTDYGTLKRGTNVYKINARDKDNNILDSFTYTVTY